MDKGFDQELFNKWLRDRDEKMLKVDFGHLASDSIVVDAGAYKGIWAKQIFEEHGCRPICFEPLFYDYIKGFQVHKYALGSEDGTANISLDNDGSSVERSTGSDSKEIQIRDVVSVFDKMGFSNINLLKLNIEGSEYSVLERLLDWSGFESIDSILIQFHRFPEGYEERRNKIRERMSKTHEEIWCYDYIWERWDRRDL